jgi:hypothetical protein
LAGEKLTDKVMELSIATFFLATVFIAALTSLATADYASIDPTVKTILTIFVPTVAGLVIAYGMYKEVRG